MKKILPMTYPTITTRSGHANSLSVLENYEKTASWIYSNYIQLYCDGPANPDIHKELALDFFWPSINPFFNCPFFHIQCMDRELICNNLQNTKKFLIHAINQNNYIFTIINQNRIFRRENDPFFHETFFFGYDLEKNVFHLADFTFSGTGKYSYTEADMDEVCQGLLDVKSWNDYLLQYHGGIVLAKYIPEGKYEFDLGKVRTYFEDYLKGENSFAYLEYGKEEILKERVYGLNVYPALIHHLRKNMENNEPLDLRVFHDLFDHKVLMLNRIQYMNKQGYLSMPAIEFENVKKKADILWMLCAKQVIKDVPCDKNLFLKLAGLINYISEKEESLYSEVVSTM